VHRVRGVHLDLALPVLPRHLGHAIRRLIDDEAADHEAGQDGHSKKQHEH